MISHKYIIARPCNALGRSEKEQHEGQSSSRTVVFSDVKKKGGFYQHLVNVLPAPCLLLTVPQLEVVRLLVMSWRPVYSSENSCFGSQSVGRAWTRPDGLLTTHYIVVCFHCSNCRNLILNSAALPIVIRACEQFSSLSS